MRETVRREGHREERGVGDTEKKDERERAE